ncbi:MAG: hypothetical protein ACTSUV_00570 [Candidatus Ranarchaeia archaeon]
MQRKTIKSLLMLTLLLITFTSILYLTPSKIAAADSTDIYYSRVNRNILADTTGVFFVNDTMIVFNNGTSPVYQDTYAIPKALESNYGSVIAYGSGGVELEVTKNSESGYYVDLSYTIIFNEPVLSGQEFEYTVSTAYNDQISFAPINLWTVGSDQEFMADFYRLPILQHEILNATIWYGVSPSQTEFFNKPTGSLVILTAQGNGWLWEIGHVDPLDKTEFTTHWRDNLESPREYNITRKISIDIWGFLHVEEYIDFRLRGLIPEDKIDVYLPLYSQNISCRDHMGLVPVTERETKNNLIHFEVIPRYTLATNSSYSFSISYRIPLNSYQSSEGLLMMLDMDVHPVCDGIIRFESVSLNFPADTIFSSISTQPSKVEYNGFLVKLVYENQDSTPIDKTNLEILYLPSYLSSSIRPLIFSLIIGLIAVSFIFARVRTRDEITQVPKMKKDQGANLIKFSELHDEKFALIIQIEKLDTQRSRKKVSNREYNERKRRYEANLKTLNVEIKKINVEIKKRKGRIAEIARNLESLEAQRDNSIAVISNLNKRYLVRRIGRRVYDDLKAKEESKMKKLTRKIDSLIFELKQAAIS